jgi:hypothetical protein
MNYPASLSNFIAPNIKVFSSREQYEKIMKLPCPAWNPNDEVQMWVDVGPAPTGFSLEHGHLYNVLGRGPDGYFRVEQAGVPWKIATRVNIPPSQGPGGGIPILAYQDFPMRELRPIPETGGFEVIASSPWGVEVVDSAHLDVIGMLQAPQDVIDALPAGTVIAGQPT